VAVVVDAGIVVALFTPDPHQAMAQTRYRAWVTAGEERHAPAVMLYELLNVLARQVWDGALTAVEADAVWADLGALGIRVHAFEATVDGPRSLAIARLLRRRHATDCAYVSLAERLGAVVWTLDSPFAQAAGGAGLPVQLLA
jgi:predicted nucleic acid-binding protein